MTLDQDVWRAAAVLIDTHGDDAPLYALQSVDQFVERGDFHRAEQWRRVWRAAVELLRSDPVPIHRMN